MRRPPVGLVAPFLLVLLCASPAEGQWRPQPAVLFQEGPTSPFQVAPREGAARQAVTVRPRHVGYSILGGVGGALVGVIGGAYVGYHMDPGCNCEDPGLGGLVAGMAFGPAIMVPLGTHLASGQSEALPPSFLVSGLIGLLAYATAWPTNGFSVLLAPIAQIAGSAVIGHRMARFVEE